MTRRMTKIRSEKSGSKRGDFGKGARFLANPTLGPLSGIRSSMLSLPFAMMLVKHKLENDLLMIFDICHCM